MLHCNSSLNNSIFLNPHNLSQKVMQTLRYDSNRIACKVSITRNWKHGSVLNIVVFQQKTLILHNLTFYKVQLNI